MTVLFCCDVATERRLDMADEKVIEKEGIELDMGIKPTAEEIAEAKRIADEWEDEQDG